MHVARAYQEEAINSIYEYFCKSTGDPLVCMPTATGKSYVIAEFIRRAFAAWPMTRALVLVHVKELIEQNSEELLGIWPNAPIGINSAGLGQRDTVMPIIFGGIASCYQYGELFGHRDLCFVDEAHLMSPEADTMYQKLFAKLREINPKMKVIGLTATWYRLKHGTLTESGLFTDICFNICNVEGFARLIHEGYLSPPIPQVTRTKLDISDVGMSGGDFIQGQLQKAVDKQDVTYAAIQEMCERGWDRKAWLVFCSGIEHADHCAEMLNYFGVPATSIHSKVPAKERKRRYEAWKAGEYRAATNNNVLTTGVNYPAIDLIGCLRPTLSPSLWVQMIGRGTRMSPDTGKVNCLVLDYARNSERLGPIDDPKIPRPKLGGGGELPVKICDSCGTYNHIRAKFCICCGSEFSFAEKLVRHAAPLQLLSHGQPIFETFDISRIMYNRHVGKKSQQASIKVSYLCGLNMFSEFVSFDIGGLPGHLAREWWRQRHTEDPPATTDEALKKIMECRTPRRVKVWVNKGKFPQVMGVEW